MSIGMALIRRQPSHSQGINIHNMQEKIAVVSERKERKQKVNKKETRKLTEVQAAPAFIKQLILQSTMQRIRPKFSALLAPV